MDTAEIRSKITELMGMKGYHWLAISAQDSDYQVSIAKDDAEGLSGTYVLVVYPFPDEPAIALGDKSIFVPSHWQLRDFELNERAEYIVTGSTPESVAKFVADVFVKLFNEEPIVCCLQP